VKDRVVIEVRSVVKAVKLLQHWSEQEDQQQHDCTDFGKLTRHAPPSTEFSIHANDHLVQTQGVGHQIRQPHVTDRHEPMAVSSAM
jgi:hypothetical protein